MTFLGVIVACALAAGLVLPAVAFQPEAAAQEPTVVEIWSATDEAAITPVIARFEALNPMIDIAYTEFNTAELHRAVLEAERLPDLVMSSSMDLQVDLVNAGYAMPVEDVPETPDWSRWRDELFGFTREPVALVYDLEAFAGRDLPVSRSDLAGMLRDDPAFFNWRVGTYDVTKSGVGYMFATQDAQRGYQASRLVESLGRAHTHLYCCTSDMIEDIVSRNLVLAYNVIGSYAGRMVRDNPRLGLLYLSDYALLFTRSVFVARGATHSLEAKNFVRFLLSEEGQSTLRDKSSLDPVVGENYGEMGVPGRAFEGGAAFLPIRLRPDLLTWLDDRKKERFLREWRASMAPVENLNSDRDVSATSGER